MCIAILNTKGAINKQTLLNCWNNNNDGAGMIYTSNGILKTYKELNSFEAFYKEYSKQRKANKNSNFVLHFRIATSGKIDLNNCHPFSVNKNLAFVHNGMIDIEQLNINVSDTYTFNETILKNLGSNFTKNEAIIRLIETYIGYSKLVFLNSSNEALIVNEELGHWDGVNWYSNTSYKQCAIKSKSYKPLAYAKYYAPNVGDECDLCTGKDAKWNSKYSAFLCEECNSYYERTQVNTYSPDNHWD